MSRRPANGVPIPLPEIAKAVGVSRNYLEQLTMLLKSNCLLRGVSGRKGGYLLAKPPNEIRVLDIVRATIGPIQLTEPLPDPQSRSGSPSSECQKLWQLLTMRIQSFLEGVSLADLLDEGWLAAMDAEMERIHRGTARSRRHERLNASRLPAGFWQGPAGLEPGLPAVTGFEDTGGVDAEDYLELLRWLEEELRIRLGDPSVSIPVDKPNAKLLYVTNLREIKYNPFPLLAAAEILYAAGEDWTMVTAGWEGDLGPGGRWRGEAGLSSGSEILSKARSLEAGKIVFSDCPCAGLAEEREGGRACPGDVTPGSESFLQTMFDYVRTGRIRLDPSRTPGPVTYHDPCILGRYYGITEEPRFLLERAVSEFREMYPNRRENWCCRGGGGLPTEYNTRRAEMLRIKRDQILETKAKIVATSCPNCIDGLGELFGPSVADLKIKSVVEIVSEALIHG